MKVLNWGASVQEQKYRDRNFTFVDAASGKQIQLIYDGTLALSLPRVLDFSLGEGLDSESIYLPMN